MPALHDAFCPAAAPFLGARPPGRALARRRLSIGPASFVVLACHLEAGRLAPRMGLDTVILGVARLRQRHGVDAMLLVALAADAGAKADSAADAELARLRELVRALAMTTHARFLVAASMNKLRDCHAAADVLASTRWRMADAGTAMAYALPIAGSAVGNRRGAARSGVTGAVIPPHDAEALADHLAHLARLPRGRSRARTASHPVTTTAP